MLNRVIIAGTGSAGFSLFHPLDLVHRLESDVGWEFDDDVPEIADGRLVTFGTGGDGGHSFRVTDGELTPEELARRTCDWDFRYAVRHGRVFLDGSDNIPMNQQSADPLDETSRRINRDCWIELPNGDYKVSVHAIWCFNREGNNDLVLVPELTDYVIQFAAVQTFDSIPAVTRYVQLLAEDPNPLPPCAKTKITPSPEGRKESRYRDLDRSFRADQKTKPNDWK